MKTLFFYTKDYCGQLKEIGFNVENNNYSNYYLLTINSDELEYKKLSHQLKKIVFESNPLTKNSSKIRNVIDKKFFHSFERNISSDIRGILNENVHFNLDGYILFHLNKYREAIDNALYLLVKNYLY